MGVVLFLLKHIFFFDFDKVLSTLTFLPSFTGVVVAVSLETLLTWKSHFSWAFLPCQKKQDHFFSALTLVGLDKADKSKKDVPEVFKFTL